jgi:hypothetical protein
MNPSGIQNPTVIDLVTHNPETDEYALIMIQTEPWNDSNEQLDNLVGKINFYFSVAIEGDLVQRFPGIAGSPLRFQLDCPSPPTSSIAELIDLVEGRLREYGIRFVVNLVT